jgi:hypothetical protein
MAKIKIIIEVDDGNKTVIIEVDGKEYIFESVALFAGDAKNNKVFIKMFGASADAAWSYAQGFRLAQGQIGTALKSFYKQCAAHIAQIIDPNAFRNEVSVDGITNKWECTDQTKWAGWDTEDVLIDKQISEAKKKEWN